MKQKFFKILYLVSTFSPDCNWKHKNFLGLMIHDRQTQTETGEAQLMAYLPCRKLYAKASIVTAS